MRGACLACSLLGTLREIDGLTFLAEAMADRGAVVLATAYRGMDMRPDDQDCLDGIRYLNGLDQVDPARIAIVGHSRGGDGGAAQRLPKPTPSARWWRCNQSAT